MKKIVELIIGNSEQSNADAATIQLPVLEVMIEDVRPVARLGGVDRDVAE